jgi:hypothetical protein
MKLAAWLLVLFLAAPAVNRARDDRPEAEFACQPGAYYPALRCQSAYTHPHTVRWHIYPEPGVPVTLSGSVVSWEPEPGATYRVVGEVNRGGVAFEQELVVKR